MGIGFRGICRRLQLRSRAKLALLNLLKRIVVKIASAEHKEEFAAEWKKHDQETDTNWRSLHRSALFTSVGQALTQWAEMEELLIAIASLLLRMPEVNKVGTIMYSIMSFPVWISIIDDLFLLEPMYITLKPTWDKITSKLLGLKGTRDRLEHHTIHHGAQASALGATALKPGQFDFRQKAQKYQPLDYDQISTFIDSLGKVHYDLIALLKAMTDLLNRDTSQRKSSEQGPGQNSP